MRKKLPKILKTIFLLIFICQMIGLIVLLALPNLSQAEEKKPIEFTPQVGIPVETGDKYNFQGGKIIIDENSIGIYIKSIYKYAIGIVGILAAVVLMMGGVIWLTAGGNQTRVGEAKAWIGASLTGLIIALTSYLILATVNPALVQFRPIEMATVEDKNTGCCDKEVNGTHILSKTTCEKEGGAGAWHEFFEWDEKTKTCKFLSPTKCKDTPKPSTACAAPQAWTCCRCIGFGDACDGGKVRPMNEIWRCLNTGDNACGPKPPWWTNPPGSLP